LAAVAGDGQVALSWSPPADSGGSPVTRYIIYRAAAGGTKTPIVALWNALAYTDTDVTNDVAYSYTVAAINSFGEGPSSNEVTATPHAPASNTENTTSAEQSPWPVAVLPVIVLAAVLIIATLLILVLKRKDIDTK
jgi:hypothetical protein